MATRTRRKGAAQEELDHLAQVRAEEALVDEVEHSRDEVREQARRALGVTGDPGDKPPPLRQTLAMYHLGIYPMVAIGLLGVVDLFQTYAFAVLTPEISRALGIGKGVIGGIIALKTLSVALAPLPVAALSQRRARRAMLCIVTGIIWSLFAIGTGFTLTVWGLVLVLVADGLSTGSVVALHPPLLLDSYPSEARVRVLSGYWGFTALGQVISPLLVAFLAAVVALTWRGVFVTLGSVSLLAALVAVRLRDPGYGKWDTDQIRATVREHHGEGMGGAEITNDDVSLRFFEIVRRVLMIPTIRRLMAALAVFGILLIPYQTFLFFFLDERWGLGPGARGVFLAGTAAVSIVALLLFGRRGEAAFRANPGRVLRVAGVMIIGAVVLIGLGGLSPWFWGMVACFAGSQALIAIVNPALQSAQLSVVAAHMRPHTAALGGIFLGGVGGIIGALFLSGIDRRFGIGGTMVALVVPGIASALILMSTGRLVAQDLDRMIDEVIEDEEIRRVTSEGGRLPMLSCRNIDFSYGQLQVLFDVDFTVDDGEMVALLGVNGAGKSTLLKVISGIGLPSRGSVRFRGTDITFLDAERRLRLGVTQIPGGRAVFGPMTVVENLRSFGYTLGRDTKGVDSAIERCFDAFPRLAERRNQNASTLSGGEQQMLGLSKGLILRPQLLLIDELSLGLAPVIVGQLLEMVRRINADGTAVVLVEQSVNIALNLVDHAYFMEKGEIRFDGPAQQLLARDDLLRAVFLEGAGASGASAPKKTAARKR
ncbi:MAG: MFS transporter [Actinobacteria bacterium]|nr:MFS transporter [Actinomycetota bacterium]